MCDNLESFFLAIDSKSGFPLDYIVSFETMSGDSSTRFEVAVYLVKDLNIAEDFESSSNTLKDFSSTLRAARIKNYRVF